MVEPGEVQNLRIANSEKIATIRLLRAQLARLRKIAKRIDAHCEWEPGRHRTDGLDPLLEELREVLAPRKEQRR